LIGLDKDEISDEAIRIGTYPISIIPDQDCCQLFTPKHPATRASVAQAEAAEAALPVEEIVERAVAEVVVEQFSFPPKRAVAPSTG
jgi:thiamine biosynthesis protein ThiI